MKRFEADKQSVSTDHCDYVDGMPSAEAVLNNLKTEFGVRTNRELSDVLEVRANTISTWKKRNSLDYARLIGIGKKYGMDLNRIFLNNIASPQHNDIIAVPRELQYQYVTRRRENAFLETLPRYRFPFRYSENARAFQMADATHSFNFRGVSYVIGEPDLIEKELQYGETYVIVSEKRGLFIGRVEQQQGSRNMINVITRDNEMMKNSIGMDRSEIMERWKVTNMIFQDLIG
ncbi:helix-turn-helix domain-containing protein [Sinomicrobium soli]|uniref:helix-turn-helix domain-containing protein n=1 Tax=Sinomicrobium sp. N-1-3-6 TaxID=2219864 RepID=UPI000DCCC68A|nr:helix-turn-helix domain-containing protein [Sinomicrobium sp. N-1-3-6]RAV27754.1 hypothetical protein DN748_17195 [Sinomicrobium sp. N-1-3-6]